ncbi:SusE domain-containing protein [Limibacter armeniacum]|uniref:SusE domain-containing protein n=1 Tax=Limibacter armeniacum TaxID=466084 RepID=UPI002FE65BFB
MKSYKLLIVSLFCLLQACVERENIIVNEELVSPAMVTPEGGTTISIDENNLGSELTVTWNEADYGVDLAVTYIVQLDFVDNLFATPAILAATQEASITVSYSELNDMVIGTLGQNPNETAKVELRVVAQSEGFNDLNSELVTLSVGTYASAGEPPVITSELATTITAENIGDAYTIEWDAADFGSTSDVVYTVEMDVEGNDFANAITLGKVTETSLTVTNEALNFYLMGNLMQEGNTAVNVAFRVVATSATNELASETGNGVITTLDIAAPAMLWTPGGYQGWKPEESATLIQTGDNIFDGYVYLNAETDLKLTSHPDYNHTNYGFIADGTLSTDDAAEQVTFAAGFYRIQPKLAEMTYESALVESFGLIGTATSGGWENSTPMTYDAETDTWRVTTDLIVGALKFRANNDWGINYGVGNITSKRGQLYFDGASYDVKEEGNYTVILSFNTQKAPYQFNYEIIKN